MGNVGGISAKLLFEEGAKIVAVSDVSGGLFNPEGLNIPDILSFISANRGVLLKDYSAPGVKHISNGELLKLDVAMLIPAALENQINEKNAKDIRAKIIVEAANGPTTVEADHILQEKKVLVVPDILANAGGVIVSYFEWVQNIQSLTWNEATANKRLEDIITNAFTAVWDITEEKKVSMRTGAYLIAVKKLVDSNNIRGIWP
jgi:glutamate dehydrogenase (NAD(P)+)